MLHPPSHFRYYLCFICLFGGLRAIAQPRVLESLDIAAVWSAHPVGFALLTHPPHQFVAYYDAARRLTIAWRSLDSQKWSTQTLPSTTTWDSHNYLTLAIDSADHLHLSGNMHCVRLIYFRTTQGLDPSTFQKIPQMVGQNEQSCTYPQFLAGPKNELLFTYRDGRSGSGSQIYNVYNPATQSWSRLFDKPLTDGQGKGNAYPHGPVRSPDGLFHVCWVWRNTPDCATNHTLSYARSKDFIHWETSTGKPLPLPLTLQNSEIVDPVPVNGGMINGNTILGFDRQNRPLIAYHKFDRAGNTQLHLARPEGNTWTSHQLTHWTYRWNFSGGGAINFEIHLGPVAVSPDGSILVAYSHGKHGSGTLKLDSTTLEPLAQLPRPLTHPPELTKAQSPFPAMQVHWQKDSTPNTNYWLRWETLPANRDRPIEKPWPEPTPLRLYKFAPEK
ncbi:MAG: BNR repeat-containing protein [Planctomycetota bacterium]|nr:BNR repeat-containing protein [Planctomycetota bacterium]